MSMTTVASVHTISPLSPTIGAEIGGLDLRQPLPDSVIASLRAALVEWKVLFFRDQPLTTDEHLAFARCFGLLEKHPFAPSKPDFPEVLAITHDGDSPGYENTWHSDVTWRLQPSLGLPAKFTANDLLTGATHAWRSGRNYVGLDPGGAHVITVTEAP